MMPAWLSVPLILSVAAAALAGAGALVVVRLRKPELRRLLAAADAALAARNPARAANLYRRAAAAADHDRTGSQSPEFPELRRRAYVGMGAALASANRRTEAFDAFQRARSAGIELPAEAQILIAERYVESGDRGPEAFEAYLGYVRIGPPSGAYGAAMCALVQQICEVQETMKSADRNLAVERNRRALAFNPNSEWAHYNLGLASLLDGRADEAAAWFLRAHSLNPGQILTAYWLGVCYLERAEPDLNLAMHWMDRFLAVPANNQKTVKRQAGAAFEIGRRLLDEDRVAPAIAYLQAAQERNAGNPECNYYLGCALASTGNAQRAVDLLSLAARLAPRQKAYAYRLAVECEKAGRLEEAAAALRNAVQADDAYAEAHARLAAICLKLGDDAAAALHSKRCLELRPGGDAMTATLVEALYRLDRFEEAIAALSGGSAATLTAGAYPEAVFCIGRIYLRCGDHRRAIEWLEKLAGQERADYYRACAMAHDGHPSDAAVRFAEIAERGGAMATAARAQRGHVLLAEGRVEEAETCYHEVLTGAPADPDALRGLAYIACAAERFEEGFVWLDRAATMDGASAGLRFARAVLLERLGRLDAAAADQQEIALDPAWKTAAILRLAVVECHRGNFQAALNWLGSAAFDGVPDVVLFYRGVAMISTGRIAEAIRDWADLHARYPDDERLAQNLHRARYLLGAQLASEGRLPESIAAWQTYLALCPADEKTVRDLAALHFRLAWTELEKSDRDAAAALAQIEQALARHPDHPQYLFYAALCELSLNRLASCEPRLRRLVASQPVSRHLYHLALCLLRRGEGDGAIEVLEQLQAKAPGDDYTARGAWLMANEEVRQGRYGEATRRMAFALRAIEMEAS